MTRTSETAPRTREDRQASGPGSTRLHVPGRADIPNWPRSGVTQVSMVPSPAGAAKPAVPFVCTSASHRWAEAVLVVCLEDLQAQAWGASWAEPRPCPQGPGPVSSSLPSPSRGPSVTLTALGHRSAPHARLTPSGIYCHWCHPSSLWAEVREGWRVARVRQEVDGLQVRHLRPASRLYFKMEITTGTG